MTTIPTGRYRHYKGQEYSVLGLVRHSETQEDLVLYRQEYGDHGLWVRPAAMFSEFVEVDGRRVPRFEHVGLEQAGDKSGVGNLLADLPSHPPKEWCETILSRPGLRIERIVSHGHASPADFWYDQDQHEFVLLLAGSACLRFEDETIEMRAGNFLNIPAHRRHRVEWTDAGQPTVWLAVHYDD